MENKSVKKIYLRTFPLKDKVEDIFIAEGDNTQALFAAADAWMLQRGMQRDKYSRYWCEDETLFCDYGSWSKYLIITPYSDKEFADEFLGGKQV